MIELMDIQLDLFKAGKEGLSNTFWKFFELLLMLPTA